jgi:hypothetical protein
MWYRRLMGWGLTPLFVTGLLAGLAPGEAAPIAAAGALAMVGLSGLIAGQAFRCSRSNQKRYAAARAVALEEGKIVKMTTTVGGEYEYTVAEAPRVEKLDWPPPA